MAIKAVAIDDAGIHHLVIGLTRENVDSLLDGDVFTFPAGYLTGLTEDSDVVLLFAETDNDLEKGPSISQAELVSENEKARDGCARAFVRQDEQFCCYYIGGICDGFFSGHGRESG